ncbi:hypothetical protein NMG60_11006770 [Bertholletia excelsa]
MLIEEPKQSPPISKHRPPKDPDSPGDGEKVEMLFSPRFRSVAAMAGWDEEALLVASLVVEDTPDRGVKHKKRSDLQFKSPPTNSRRKRRVQRRSHVTATMPVLELGEDDPSKEDSEKKQAESKSTGVEERKVGESKLIAEPASVSCSSSNIPCMDRLREELSCAICLDICFEPSTTSCGHSFCKKCLHSAAEKCGKRCPKCRQLISNGRSCTVNTVLWNTIQLLFPQEVEAKKEAVISPSKGSCHTARNQRVQALYSPEAEGQRERRRRTSHHQGARNPTSSQGIVSVRSRRTPSQDEDAALALRLQREEFMGAFRGSSEQYRNSLFLARANLRTLASRAINVSMRSRPT